jgi:hypothetical protein
MLFLNTVCLTVAHAVELEEDKKLLKAAQVRSRSNEKEFND